MICLKLLIIIICAVLNVIGGYSWHNARRFIMPIIISVTVSISVHLWWLGLTCLPAIAPICLGYGEKSLLWKYFNDALARFVWMALVSIFLCIGAVLTGHLIWYMALIYIIFNGIIGTTLRKINQLFGDAIFGISLSSIVFIVH